MNPVHSPRNASRLAPVKGLTLDNSVNGSKEKRGCGECFKTQRISKVTISSALRLIRVKYGLPYVELPDLKVEDLSRYLSFLLLQGKPRAPVAFPRRQRREDKDGLCSLQRLCKRDRWELAHSIASIKRSLPAGCRFCTASSFETWKSRAFSTPPPSSPEFIRFARRITSKMFPLGWDTKYDEFVTHHVPNASARFSELDADDFWKGHQKHFIRECIKGLLNTTEPLHGRFKDVLSAGKSRPLLIFDYRVEYLAPLHKTIYDHLSKKSWLLVGSPDAERISSVCRFANQTSVDLVNASDNLSLDVTEAILGTLLAKSSKVPGSVKLLASNSLYPRVFHRKMGYVGNVSHGQMMGAYLSFPLLCLHSYIAASWAARGTKHAILVNGDDTLISSDRPIELSSYPAGYELNVLKTIRSEVVAEINSTAFLKGGKGKWREVRHLRRGGFVPDYYGMMHIASAVRNSAAWSDALVRSRVGKHWGFLPSQLGLHPASHASWKREMTMSKTRIYSDLPDPPGGVTGLSMRYGTADPDERLAVMFHIFANGRERRKRDQFNPPKGLVWKTFAYRKSGLRSHITYLCYRETRMKKKRDIYFVPAEYVSRKEERSLRPVLFSDEQYWLTV